MGHEPVSGQFSSSLIPNRTRSTAISLSTNRSPVFSYQPISEYTGPEDHSQPTSLHIFFKCKDPRSPVIHCRHWKICERHFEGVKYLDLEFQKDFLP
jgi:hypothetical protein